MGGGGGEGCIFGVVLAMRTPPHMGFTISRNPEYRPPNSTDPNKVPLFSRPSVGPPEYTVSEDLQI